MRMTLKNLGPISQATLEDAPMTLLVGENGSGKSTIVQAFYAAVRSLPSVRLNRQRSVGRPSEAYHRSLQLRNRIFRSAQAESMKTISDVVDTLCVDLWEILGDLFLENLTLELPRVFGADDLASLMHRETGKRSRPLKIEIENSGLWVAAINTVYRKPVLRFESLLSVEELQRTTSMRVEELFEQRFGAKPSEEVSVNLPINAIGPDFIPSVVEDLFLGGSVPPRAHLLPAARAGILQAHRLVASSVMQSAAYVGLSDVNYPGLTGVTADFISELLSSPSTRRQKASFPRSSRCLEGLLNGRIESNLAEGQYPEITYTSETSGSLPVHRASSMINELTPLILLLRGGGMQHRHLLILEEPESHLHPKLQRLLAEVLIQIVDEGGRVMVTTHSDYFMNELNLATRRAAQDKNKGSAVTLSPEMWTSYRLEAKSSGSILLPISREDDGAYSDAEFSDVALAQYDARIELDDAGLDVP